MAGWLCSSGIPPIRVVHGDGQVLTRLPPVTVSEILSSYPHHYICHMSPELPSNRSAMLPVDYELEPGYVYFLLPLPRLFPTSSAPPTPCCCLPSQETTSTTSNPQKVGYSPCRVKQIFDIIGSPLRGVAKKKVSPELTRCNLYAEGYNSGEQDFRAQSPLLSPTYGSLKRSVSPKRSLSPKRSPCRWESMQWKKGGCPKRSVSPKSSPSRLWESAKARNNSAFETYPPKESLCSRWKPGLGCISETTEFGPACEELRLCLDRRRLTFDGKERSNSPVRFPSRDVGLTRESFNSASPNKHVPLAAYIYV